MAERITGGPVRRVLYTLIILAIATLGGPITLGATVQPEVIVQVGHVTPVRATLWTADSAFLFSLADDGTVLVWDVATRAVLDRTRIPWPLGSPVPKVLGFSADADGRTARITLAADAQCPAAAIGAGGSCSFDLDLASRAVSPVAAARAPDTTGRPLYARSPDHRLQSYPNHGDGYTGLVDPSDEHYDWTADCVSISLCRYGITLIPATSTAVGPASADAKMLGHVLSGNGLTGSNSEQPPPADAVVLNGNPLSYFLDADLTADGRRMLRLESLARGTQSRIQLLDMHDNGESGTFEPAAAYHRIRFLDAGHYALFSQGHVGTDDVYTGGFPPILVVDDRCATPAGPECLRIPARALARPIDARGTFVGTRALTDDCFRGRQSLGPDGVSCFDDQGNIGRPRAKDLMFYSPDQPRAGWTRRAIAELAGANIDAIEVAPRGQQLAVSAHLKSASTRSLRVLLVPGAPTLPPRVVWSAAEPRASRPKGAAGAEPVDEEPLIEYFAFAPDGQRLLFGYRGRLVDIDLTESRPARSLPFETRRIATDGRHALLLDSGRLVDLETGAVLAQSLQAGSLVKAGFLDGKPIAWGASDDGVLRFWNSTSGAVLATLYSFPGNRFFAVSPEGRYDTNLGPDTSEVRWLMPDAPWQSLAAQTFMRDYYEPRLLERLFACTGAVTCGSEFRPVRPLDQVNRVLPHVEIASVTPGAAPGTADVCVTATETVESRGSEAARHSGLHDLRLFRDGRLIAERGAAPPDLDTTDLAEWAKRTAVGTQSCPDAGSVFTVGVPQPSGTPAQFTAYAFNSERIKGETSAPVSYAPPPVAPRTPRAYVIAIGINSYVNIPGKSLSFAVNDARAISRVLSTIPHYEVVDVQLTSEPDRNRATKALLRAVFGIIGGEDMAANRQQLQAAGIDATRIEPSRPDDVVIVSYSGHGYADRRGNFYLLPSDALFPDEKAPAAMASLISSAELAAWLRNVDAADIALVIDACHSAASVAAAGFKPGPMGDPGLGQLSFDKGIRILAATQADDVANEDGRLHQGLLTFALTGDGAALRPSMPAQGVTLDHWLRAAARRLPSLAQDVRTGRVTASDDGERGFTLAHGPTALPPAVQEPSLFDFTGKPSRVLLFGSPP